MGKPTWGHAHVLISEYIGYVEGTGGTETSQYPKEEKIINDSGSSGERTRKSPNFNVSEIYFRTGDSLLTLEGCENETTITETLTSVKLSVMRWISVEIL